mgnify:FL=1
MQVEALRFQALAGATAPRAVSAWQLFQTPEHVAASMVARALWNLPDLNTLRILEPSAGLGRIYRALRARTDAHITLIETAPQCAAELYRETEFDTAAKLTQADFLTVSADQVGRFDVVVMNPPFERGTDVKHIRHAQTLLNPGGRLVSLCYAGSVQRRTFENAPGWTWNMLPAGTFRAEGTSADVAMITNF